MDPKNALIITASYTFYFIKYHPLLKILYSIMISTD